MILAETFPDLLGSGAHWLFELTTDLVFAVVMFPFGRAYQRWHDRTHHGATDD